MKDKENLEKEEELTKFTSTEEDERRRPPLLFLIILTTVTVLLALGLSLSAVLYMETNETINTIISTIKGDNSKKDAYIVTYSENTGLYQGGINLINQFPTSDEVGKLFSGENYVFNFSLLVGKKTEGVYYEITAVPDSSNTLESKDVKLYLEKNGTGVDLSFVKNKIKTFDLYDQSEYSEAVGKVIYKGYVTKEDIKKGKIDFVMRMWVSEDCIVDNNFSNKKFAVKVNTYATSKSK